MSPIKKATLLMWVCLVLCALSPFVEYDYAVMIDELTTSFILLALAIMTNRIIAYALLALSVGKLIDGVVNPDVYSTGELIWDILVFLGAIVMYSYRKKHKAHKL